MRCFTDLHPDLTPFPVSIPALGRQDGRIDEPLSPRDLDLLFDDEYGVSLVSYHVRVLADYGGSGKSSAAGGAGCAAIVLCADGEGTGGLAAALRVSVRITAPERDALFDQIYVRLSGIDNLWLAAEEEDWEAADRLARQYIDELRLVLEDLGWGPGSGKAVDLKTPPDVLRRVLTRMQEQAEAQQEAEEEEREEGRVREEQRQRLMQTCRRVLAEL